MKLYNTLTRRKDEFEPADAPNVSLYCCGPTVYNYAHIGNLRTYVFEDILRRALEFNGHVVNHVMNITDVGHLVSDADEGEDKMLKGAQREKMTVWDIAEKYTQAFLEDMDRLNFLKPTMKPKATDHVKDMIAQIKKLEKNGYTYIGSTGNVYYDTSKFKHYDELAQLDKQTLQAGARIEVDTNKKNPHDFVLWFVESKHGNQEMQWDSPWGRGFPGWHIECSAMSIKYLGEQIDIHCGGIDHIPVHHTNEIAQAEGATGKHPWVKCWMHGNFLVIKKSFTQFKSEINGKIVECPECGKTFEPTNKMLCPECGKKIDNKMISPFLAKMAKSGENFLTLTSLIQKGYDALDYRYFCLQSNYRKELAFDWEGLDSARVGLRRLKEKVFALGTDEGEINQFAIEEFKDAINDDLNMPQAMAVVWNFVENTNIKSKDRLATIKKMDEVLGLKLDEEIMFELPPQITEWILERNEARKKKDWKKADEIRNNIEKSGKWIVKDGVGGTEVSPK